MIRRLEAFQRHPAWIAAAVGITSLVVAGAVIGAALTDPAPQTDVGSAKGPTPEQRNTTSYTPDPVQRVTPTPTRTPKPPPGPLPPESPSPRPEKPPEPREPVSDETMCGISYIPELGQTTYEGQIEADRRFDGLDMLRIFYTEPPPWPGWTGRAARPVVVSFKLKPDHVLAGKHDDAVRSWFNNAPREHDIYWSLHHEPEDNLEDGEFTAEEYRAAWRRLAAMADASGNPRLWSTLILMDWTLDPLSGRDWRDFYAGDDVIDVLAFDVYNHGVKEVPQVYLSAQTQLERIVDLVKSVGKPFGIAELGAVRLPGDHTGEARADWIRDMTDYLTEHDALWATYFDIDHAENADYRLRDDPSIQAWRDFCDR